MNDVPAMRHYHTQEPFLCIKATMMGWAVSPKCDPELVELCSETVVGDVSILPDLDSMFQELSRRGVDQTGLEALRNEMQPQAA